MTRKRRRRYELVTGEGKVCTSSHTILGHVLTDALDMTCIYSISQTSLIQHLNAVERLKFRDKKMDGKGCIHEYSEESQ